MQDDLCEMRFDVPLPEGADAPGFERAWRETLAARRVSAQAVTARFRLFAPDLDGARASAWTQYLTARLAALPGGPTVAAAEGAGGADSGWRGVKVWLTYPAPALTTLLKPPPRKKTHRDKTHRGRRP